MGLQSFSLPQLVQGSIDWKVFTQSNHTYSVKSIGNLFQFFF